MINDCIIHKGCKDKWGYGVTKHRGHSMSVHRKAYIKAYGKIPEGMIVRHKCDNPLCINPKHLLIGTHADNVQDRVARERSAKGEKHGRSKLTIKNVIYIKQHPEIRRIDLARKFGVSPKAIYLIRKGINWKHLGDTHGK